MNTNTLWHDTRALAFHLSQATTDESRIAILRNFGSDRAVKKVLGFIFDKRVYRWCSAAERKPFLPAGMPPLPPQTDRQVGPAPVEVAGALRGLLARDRIDVLFHTPFCDRSNLEPYRQEQIFIGMMTDIHPDDRKLLVGIKDKVWVHADLYDLKPSLVGRAFDDIEPVADPVSTSATPAAPAATVPSMPVADDPFMIDDINTASLVPSKPAPKKSTAAPKPTGAKKPAAKKAPAKASKSA